jgi:hypothetical protein
MRTVNGTGADRSEQERRHLMTADQLKRKFRNFPNALLRGRIAA